MSLCDYFCARLRPTRWADAFVTNTIHKGSRAATASASFPVRVSTEENRHCANSPRIDRDRGWASCQRSKVVNNGEVTLSGTVRTREEKRRSEDLTDTVTGVREVHNNLRVRGWQEGRAALKRQELGAAAHEVIKGKEEVPR